MRCAMFLCRWRQRRVKRLACRKSDLQNLWVFQCALCKTGSKGGAIQVARQHRYFRWQASVQMFCMRYLGKYKSLESVTNSRIELGVHLHKTQQQALMLGIKF